MGLFKGITSQKYGENVSSIFNRPPPNEQVMHRKAAK